MMELETRSSARAKMRLLSISKNTISARARRLLPPGEPLDLGRSLSPAQERLALQRIFHPRRSSFDQPSQLGLQLLQLELHLPGDVAIAEVAFHAAAHAGNVLGLGEIHLKEKA